MLVDPVMCGRESDDCNDTDLSNDGESDGEEEEDNGGDQSQGMEEAEEGEDGDESVGVTTGADMLALYRYGSCAADVIALLSPFLH